MAANRVAAINPPIDDTDLIRKFSVDPGSHMGLPNLAESSLKGSRSGIWVYRPNIVDMDTIADAFFADAVFADAISETSITEF